MGIGNDEIKYVLEFSPNVTIAFKVDNSFILHVPRLTDLSLG